MTWNASVVDGPIVVQDLGPADPVTGEREVLGVVSGYHLNIARGSVLAEAIAFEIEPDPNSPARVFSGDERGPDGRYRLTAFLRFADEAEAVATLPGLWIEPAIETDPPLIEEGGEP